jgi:thiamine-monophosphate kinase
MKETKHLPARRAKRGESAILEQIESLSATTPIRGSGLRLGIGDDAAVFKATRGYEQILTCDWFLEGTHFLRDAHPPEAVGWKCLARAVSDVAAIGGVPRCFLLSLALPATLAGSWLSAFLRGLRRASMRFSCALAGGDTTRRNDILVNVAVVGEVWRGTAVLRSGAKPGDLLFASGRLGEAELGLRSIREGKRASRRDHTLRKHLYPEPRLALGRWLAETRLASAMMDLSDGLSTDLPRLCAASNVGARLTAANIPTIRLPQKKRSAARDPLSLALHGGDDYELLFTVPRRKRKRVPPNFHGLPITAIGEITSQQALLLITENGSEVPLPNRGWDPFRNPR